MERLQVSMDDLWDGRMGICLACGEEHHGIEPDACRYDCEVCGKPEVYGLEEAVLMGRVDIMEGDD